MEIEGCHLQLKHSTTSMSGGGNGKNILAHNNSMWWVIGDERDCAFGPRRMAYKTAFEFGDVCEGFKKSALFGGVEPLVKRGDMEKDPDFQQHYFLLL
jgi:hypothetical protein